MKMRGLALKKLINIVHFYGGIIGPAHPCGERFLSFFPTGIFKKLERDLFMHKFDFLEGYNACEPEESNESAAFLAAEHGILMTAGSDAHYQDCVGMAYTELPDGVKTEDDLIAHIKSTKLLAIGGSRYGKTTKDKLGFLNKGLVYSFFFYNKLGALYRLPARRKAFVRLAYEMEGNK